MSLTVQHTGDGRHSLSDRLHFLRRQHADLSAALTIIPRGRHYARRVGQTRKNLVIVDNILRELAAALIAGRFA